MKKGYIKKKIDDLKYKALLGIKAKEAGFSSYDLYLEDPSRRGNQTIYLKVGSRVKDRSIYTKYTELLRDIAPGSSIKVDRTPTSIDPRFFLAELDQKLKESPSISREVQFMVKKITRNPLISGILLRMKGKVNSLRTKTKIFKEGKISYTGNYLATHRRIAKINHSTNRGVVGFKLTLFYPEPFEEL